MPRISLATIAAVASVAALVAVELLRHAPINAEARRWGEGYMPNLPVITQDGKTLRFYDDVIKGKIVVIDFIYTNCPDICGLTTARLSQVQDRLGDAVGRDIFFVSLSVDPQRDTPEKLKEYADGFHVGPGWLFLTGKPEDMRAINAALGDRSTILSEHRQQIVLGNDALGVWRRDSVLGDIDSFVMDVRSMDQKWRDKARESKRSAANTDYRISNEPGQVLYKKMCAPCHTIGVGDRAGPDLRDVTARRDHEWLANFIMDPYKMRAKKDPIALELAAKYPGVLMPRLGLTDNDAEDLIEDGICATGCGPRFIVAAAVRSRERVVQADRSAWQGGHRARLSRQAHPGVLRLHQLPRYLSDDAVRAVEPAQGAQIRC